MCVCCIQEQDAERRRQLRERARQLIAEARSGVKMADMSVLDASSAGRNNKAAPGTGRYMAGSSTLVWRHAASFTHTHKKPT